MWDTLNTRPCACRRHGATSGFAKRGDGGESFRGRVRDERAQSVRNEELATAASSRQAIATRVGVV